MTRETRRIRVLIVDDEPLARKRLRAILSKHPDVEVAAEAGNGITAVAAVAEHSPDVMLLDVQMPGLDGFGVVASFVEKREREDARSRTPLPVVIFITAHDQHAVKAFDVQALDYVLKPVTAERVLAAIDRAIARLGESRRADLASELSTLLANVDRSRRDGRLAIRTDRGVRLVPMGEVQWVEADGDLVKVHTLRTTYVMRATMADMEAELPRAQFARVHRSAIVSTACIQEVQPLFKGDYIIVLRSGAAVRSGRTYRAEVQALMKASRG
ncbi:MAG TPA: LytTR family DNA-binding domain-containing protein [Vicinamibacterales bacterium]|nr:LytTR family DNA-binding domain-containing protein [Vicinamibacterales bacterium]